MNKNIVPNSTHSQKVSFLKAIKKNLKSIKKDIKIRPGIEAFCCSCASVVQLEEIIFLKDTSRMGYWTTCVRCKKKENK